MPDFWQIKFPEILPFIEHSPPTFIVSPSDGLAIKVEKVKMKTIPIIIFRIYPPLFAQNPCATLTHWIIPIAVVTRIAPDAILKLDLTTKYSKYRIGFSKR